ncbi:MAG: transposase [Saprospiraceae bacterium]
MVLNDAGEMANKSWMQIPEHFPNAVLHEYIIMPNHIHGIIELIPVGVEDFQPLPDENPQPAPEKRNEFQNMIPRSIGSIVKGFKIGVTKWFRQTMPNEFPPERVVWLRNYYESVIGTEHAYKAISRYIINNPAKWQGDKFYGV